MRKYKNTAVGVAAVLCLVILYWRLGCPIRLLTGVSCPGCGMSRAVYHLTRLDVSAAAACHPLVFSLPVFAVLFWAFRRNRKGFYAVLGVFCVCLLAVYIWRMAYSVAPEIVYFHPEDGVIYKVIRFLRSVFLCQHQK